MCQRASGRAGRCRYRNMCNIGLDNGYSQVAGPGLALLKALSGWELDFADSKDRSQLPTLSRLLGSPNGVYDSITTGDVVDDRIEVTGELLPKREAPSRQSPGASGKQPSEDNRRSFLHSGPGWIGANLRVLPAVFLSSVWTGAFVGYCMRLPSSVLATGGDTGGFALYKPEAPPQLSAALSVGFRFLPLQLQSMNMLAQKECRTNS